MKTLFISDLHLQEETPAITQTFLKFLETKGKQADRLFILGDFFEVWVGDDHDTAFNQQITSALAATAECQTEIYILHGNRDFLLGSHFAEQAGCTLIEEPYILELTGQRKTLLMHGDLLCSDDQEYLAFRGMVRQPAWQQDFLNKPLAERLAIAKALRDNSKSMSAQKPEDIMDVNDLTVEETMASNQCELLIHGHTHRPNMHDLIIGARKAQRMVLGAWHNEGWFIEATEDDIQLQQFPFVSA